MRFGLSSASRAGVLLGAAALLVTAPSFADAHAPVARPAVAPLAAPRVAPPPAPTSQALPASLHLGAPAQAPAAAPKAAAPHEIVAFAQKSWNTRGLSLHERPYRERLQGERLPEAMEKSLKPTDRVFVLHRGPDGHEQLAPGKRLFIRRGLDATVSIFDTEGKLVASGNDTILGAAGDFAHNESTDWSGAPRGAAQRMPATPAYRDEGGRFTPAAGQAAAQTIRRDALGRYVPLPATNPDVKDTGGGSLRLSVPVAGSKLRMMTNDRTAFFEGGEETTGEDWGGRLIVPQPYMTLPNGRSVYVQPKIVNVKAIVDVRTGKPVSGPVPVEVEGRAARYEPKSSPGARGDLTLEQFKRTAWTTPGPLF